MPGFCICKRCARFRIWLSTALWQGSEYAWSLFDRVLSKPSVLNMLGLRIWQSCEYARVTQGAEVGLRGGGGLWNQGISIKISSKTPEKEALQGNILEFVSPRYSQNYVLRVSRRNKFQRWTQSGPFFQNSGHFLRFSKRAVQASPLPLVARL